MAEDPLMSTEPSVADLKSAFAAQLATLPPPPPGRHDHYRPRTRRQTFVAVAAAFVAVAAVTSAVVALVGRDPGSVSVVAPAPSLSTMDIAGTRVELPAGVRPATADDCLEVMPKSVDLSGDSSGWHWALVWWPGYGEWNGEWRPGYGKLTDCFQMQVVDGIPSPPTRAERTTVAGRDAWTWPVEFPGGPDDAQVYFIEIPVPGDDQRTTSLLVMLAGSAKADASSLIEDILRQI
jgi:hypothetical protein